MNNATLGQNGSDVTCPHDTWPLATHYSKMGVQSFTISTGVVDQFFL